MTGIQVAPDVVPGAWAASSACQGRHKLFFPPENERDAAKIAREAGARAICKTCPVFDDCYRWAMHPTNPAGDEFAAGMSKRERHNARKGTPSLPGL